MEKISNIPIFLLMIIFYLVTAQHVSRGDTTISSNVSREHEALLEFKRGLLDPNHRLSSWKGADHCRWQGITCDNATSLVISIDLGNPYARNNADDNWGWMAIGGEINPSLAKLTMLKHLDLSFNSFKEVPVPQFLGSLNDLVYLNLSSAGFSGTITSLADLSSLQYLDLSSNLVYEGDFNDDYDDDFEFYNNFSVENFEWVANLVSLKFLKLENVSLSAIGIDQLFGVIKRLPSLSELHLSSCNLMGSIPPSLGELPNLQHLDLSSNFDLEGNISQLLSANWRRIEVLKLNEMGLHGSIPGSIGKFCNLNYLGLTHNYLDGRLPEIIEGHETCSGKGVLPNLRILFLGSNRLIGKLPDWLGEVKNLKELSLSHNKLQGPIPNSLWTLKHLKFLFLHGNEFNGSIPTEMGQLSQLTLMDVSGNHLSGTLLEQHFQNLSKLEILMIDSNSFRLIFSPNWIPPFQLDVLSMESCQMGPSFPTWIQSQKNLYTLDISNAGISGPIPNWFWGLSVGWGYVNLSRNQLQGELPNSLKFLEGYIDFSFNLLEGPIPSSIKRVVILDLSHNGFSGLFPSGLDESLGYLSLGGNRLTGSIPDSIGRFSYLQFINISSNYLTGRIPSTLGNCSSLLLIDFSHNSLSGKIPNTLGHLQSLRSLHLSHNLLSGQLPSCLQNSTTMQVLDLGYNKLSGKIPAWIGSSFPSLVILSLRFNAFSGRLPSRISNLSSLHVLDVAHNNLEGEIPATLGELKGMVLDNLTIYPLFQNVSYSDLYPWDGERFVLNIKGQSLEYRRTLSLVVAIDLSYNNLRGELPQEITRLVGLVVLNLSGNHITGKIPESISMLRQLQSLDLSSNELSGVIPSGMVSLTFLAYLNLANNDFSGKVPYTGQMTTFSESAFAGNHRLCGPPLATNCPVENSDTRQEPAAEDDDDDDSFVDQWFYLSVGMGFAVGILVPTMVLLLKKSCSDIYFDFVDLIVNWLLRGRNKKITHRRNKNATRGTRVHSVL